MVDAVLHIGAPKTATSTLQMRFFPNLREVLYLGKYIIPGSDDRYFTEDLAQVFRNIETQNMDFDTALNPIKDLINKLCRENNSNTALFSDESISVFTGPTPATKLHRYQAIFDNVKIIYCVRNQMELLKSLYLVSHRSEHLRIYNFGTERMKWAPTFDQWMEINFRYCYKSLLDCLNFQSMISMYVKSVSKDDIFIYSFEEFKQDPNNILNRLCNFIGTTLIDESISEVANYNENRRATVREHGYVKLRNWFLPNTRLSKYFPRTLTEKFSNYLTESNEMTAVATPFTIERVKNFYAADNEKLDKIYGINLNVN